MSITNNELSHPEVLLPPSNRVSSHAYVDVNPRTGFGAPVLLAGAAAVFASIRNLFMCPQGGRARIFQEDYFSGVYNLLQEPFDSITAQQLSVAIYDALRLWEPRITIYSSDVYVRTISASLTYAATITIRMNGRPYTETFNLRS